MQKNYTNLCFIPPFCLNINGLLHQILFFVRLMRTRKITQLIIDTPNYFLLTYLTLLKTLVANNCHFLDDPS